MAGLKLNRHLFTETGTDSGALNVLGTLVHQFPDEGDYVVDIMKDGDPVGRRLIVVSDDHHAIQATIDLSSLADGDSGCDCTDMCSCEAEDYDCIREDGYAVFTVASGAGGYAVQIASLDERDVEEFDGAGLTDYDTFAAVLMRPGTYAMYNRLTGDEGEVTVVYPDPDRGRKAVREPVEVSIGDGGLDPAAVELHPGQGLVFRIETTARVAIELEEPHERAVEEPTTSTTISRRPRGPGSGMRRIEPRFDPGNLSVDELEAELENVRGRAELRALLLAERRDRDRSTAREVIRRRLRDLDRGE